LTVSLAEEFVNVAGVVSVVKKIVTKSNENMLFVKIEDRLSNIELLVFPRLLKETAEIWTEGNIVICRGRLSNKDNELKVLCDKAKKVDAGNVVKIAAEFQKTNNNGFKNGNSINNVSPPNPPVISPKRLSVSAPDMNIIQPLKIKINDVNDGGLLTKVKEQLTKSQGQVKVFFYVPNGAGMRIIETGFRVDANDALKEKLKELLGAGAVK